MHGFARNVDWALTETKEGDAPSITMTLLPSEYTKAMWDKDFKVTQTITLEDGALTATMKVTNPGAEAFSFTGSFHTYFAAKIDEVAVTGMEGCESLDRLANEKGSVDGAVTISGPVDSVYYDVPKDITLAVGGGDAVTVSGSGGWKDAVVWSPLDGHGGVLQGVRVRRERGVRRARRRRGGRRVGGHHRAQVNHGRPYVPVPSARSVFFLFARSFREKSRERRDDER